MTTITLGPAAYAAVCSRTRRSLAQSSPQRFARVYLPHHFTLPSSPMHDEVFEMLRGAALTRHARIAIAAPRGHAKSTVVTLATLLWSALYGHDRYIMIASATREQAAQMLRHIKDEIESNPRLLEDFPELRPARGTRPPPWRGTKLLLPSGVLIHGVGANQQVRGVRHGEHRPTLIIGDDLETPERVLSESQREKTQTWFERTLLKLGSDQTNVVVVGTVLHYDSLLARLLDPARSPGWASRRYRALVTPPSDAEAWTRWENIYTGRDAVDGATGPDAARAFFESSAESMLAGAEVLWPQRESLYDLMTLRLREGRSSFESEKQNDPVASDLCVFDAATFVYWDDQHRAPDDLLASLGRSVECCIAWDPSLGKAGSDMSAIIVTAHARDTGVVYVLAADISRTPPDTAMERIIEYARLYRPRMVVMEANAFQERLGRDLRDAATRARVQLRVHDIRSVGDKHGRIRLIEPAVRQGRLRLCRSHRVLLDQLMQFPFARHDDGPDALQMAYEHGQRPPGPGISVY